MSNARFARHAPIYAFTTENLAGYYPGLMGPGMRVLCVGGSGDHLLNAVLLGATEVVGFDLNEDAAHFAELKWWAARELSLQEFGDFLFVDGAGALAPETYRRLRPSIGPKAKTFFDAGYAANGHDGATLRRSAVFENRHDTTARKIRYNPYLRSAETYRSLQERLGSVRLQWRTVELAQLAPAVSGQSFDRILLSNIADHWGGQLASFRAVVFSLSELLEPGGLIAAAYLYNVDAPAPHHSAIDDPRARRDLFAGRALRYEEVTFDGAIDGHRDAVVLLRKR